MSRTGTSVYPASADSFDRLGTTNYEDEVGYDHVNVHNEVMDGIENIQGVLGTTAGTSVLGGWAAGNLAVKKTSGVVESGLSYPAATLGTPNITGGTISSSTLGTPTINAPKINEAVALTSTSTELNALSGKMGAWTSWTPTIANATAGTSGAVTAKYIQVGKFVSFYFRFDMGTASTMGSNPTFTLPVTSAYVYSVEAGAMIWDAGVANYQAMAFNDNNGTVSLWAVNGTGAYNKAVSITGSAPMTWGVNDAIIVSGFYQAQ